jgi:(1->4)-alpha-D-glucan 1-alpha-D-glucosylmutase
VVEEVAPGSVVEEVAPGSVVEEVALRPSRNHPRQDALADALAELLACLPVYRTYLPEGRAHLDAAFTAARRHRPDLSDVLDRLEPVLGDPASPVAQRFQQVSGAVMAKGVEDSAFYRTARLTSLTEVGGDPAEFAVSVEQFHAAMAELHRTRPAALTATTTHDTKRSEDTRARISVLAEIPETWADTLDVLLRRASVPSPLFGNLLWQAVVGAWPASRARLHVYVEKAMRESGEHSTWTDPDPAYESVVQAAVDAAFDDDVVRTVLEGFVERIAAPGYSNGLASKLLALTMPGVPDVYQGTELWDRSLVDPDNRRPVDFDVRRPLLQRVRAGDRPALSPHADDHGAAKLLVTQAALTLRRDQPHRFTTYEPIRARGESAGHVLAFDRGGALTVVTRLPVGLAARGWGETVLGLPRGRWADLLTGREYDGDALVRELLADLPVALLLREEDA